MQTLAFDFQRIEIAGVGQEGIDGAAFEQRLDVLFKERHEVLAEEQRIAAARSRILHGSAIADRDAAVIQYQQDRDTFASLADFAETVGHGLADIDETILSGARLDRLLVVEIERGKARNKMGLGNFHRGLPISLLLDMA